MKNGHFVWSFSSYFCRKTNESIKVMVNVSKLTGQLKVRGFKFNMVRKKFHWHKLDSSLTTIQLWYAKNILKKFCIYIFKECMYFRWKNIYIFERYYHFKRILQYWKQSKIQKKHLYIWNLIVAISLANKTVLISISSTLLAAKSKKKNTK